MDRTLLSPMEMTRDYDFQYALADVLKGLAFACQDVLGGTTAVVAGLAASPTAPASLTVSIAPGRIYQLADVDATTDGSITAVDDTQVVQQGIVYAQTGQTYAEQFTLTPPGTAGQSQWVLIQAIFNQADGVRANDPTNGNVYFYNPSNPTQPTQSTVHTARFGQCLVSVLYGTAAATGSEVPPQPSAGAVPLYLIDLANGQTQITSGEILVAAPSVGTGVPSNYPYAPFLAGLLNSHHNGTTGQAPKIKLGSEVQGTLARANGGTGASAPFGAALLNIQRFVGTATYTPTAGATNAVVFGIGGGGAGGAGAFSGTDAGVGGGGTSGVYGAISIPVSAINDLTVTPGNGGAGNNTGTGGNGSPSTIGSVISFPGGVGGGVLQTNATTPIAGGAAQQTAVPSAVGGTVLHSSSGIGGNPIYFYNAVNEGISGKGGASPYGAEGASAVAPPNAGINGNAAAANSGAGGSGGVSYGVATSFSGGNGGSGYIEIWEYS